MSGKTADVERFVRRVLTEFSAPYPETITNDVFCKIEDDPHLRQKYDELCRALTQDVVNPAIGKAIKSQTGLKVIGYGTPRGTTLITRYTKLG
jgi:hypothetical protein